VEAVQTGHRAPASQQARARLVGDGLEISGQGYAVVVVLVVSAPSEVAAVTVCWLQKTCGDVDRGVDRSACGVGRPVDGAGTRLPWLAVE